MNRTILILDIRAIHAIAYRVDLYLEIILECLVVVSDFDVLCIQFLSEDEFVLDYLVELDQIAECSIGLSSEV